MRNNVVTIIGKVKSYENNEGIIAVERFSGNADLIPFRTLRPCSISAGQRYCLEGILCTQNVWDDNLVMHKNTYIGVRSAYRTLVLGDKNDINIVGYLCKLGAVRSTPLSNRIIQDLIVAVNTEDPTTSYYPSCIAWGQYTIEKLKTIRMGTKVHIQGRFQSRQYKKGDELKTAYEISLRNIRIIPDEPLCEGWYEGDCEACSMTECMNYRGRK